MHKKSNLSTIIIDELDYMYVCMYTCALLIAKCVCLWVNRKDVERVGKESVLSYSGIEGWKEGHLENQLRIFLSVLSPMKPTFGASCLSTSTRKRNENI